LHLDLDEWVRPDHLEYLQTRRAVRLIFFIHICNHRSELTMYRDACNLPERAEDPSGAGLS
jgi:hypothetical protein